MSVGLYDTFGSWTLYVFGAQFSHLLRVNLEVTKFTKAHGPSCQPKVDTKRPIEFVGMAVGFGFILGPPLTE